MPSEKKLVFFAFQGEEMCFMHILLNAIDMYEKGIETRIVIEGKATALVKNLIESDNKLFKKAMDLNIIGSICEACSRQMGVLEYNEATGLPINGDLMGHPPMEPYIKAGYEIVAL